MTIVLEKAQAVKSLAIVQEAYHKISSLHASTERDVTSPNKLLIHFFKISTLRKVQTHFWFLAPFHILCNRFIPILSIAFIDGENFASCWNLHVRISENKFTEGLYKKSVQ